MKLYYLANYRLPTEKAHGLQVMKMASAFHSAGAELQLIAPNRKNWLEPNAFDYYGISQSFTIKKLPCIDLLRFDKFLKPLPIFLEMISFAFFAFFYTLFKKADVFYTRNKELLFLTLFKKNIVFEVHRPLRRGSLFFLKKAKAVIAISPGLKDLLIKQGIRPEKILVAMSAVDLAKFKLVETQEECRKKLGLSQDKKIVLYSGHLMPENGPQVLAKASQFLAKDTLVYIVGGTNSEITNYQLPITNHNNVVVVGHRPPAEVPLWLKSADVLVMPYLASDQYAKLYMSSMKMFEYMASGVVIVASDLPSVRAVLNEKNAYFAEPSNPQSLAKAIKQALVNLALSQAKAQQALADVQLFTWRNRAKNILGFLKSDFL